MAWPTCANCRFGLVLMPQSLLGPTVTVRANFAVVGADRAVHSYSMSLSKILPEVRTLSAADKLRLIRILAEEVDAEPDIAPLEHGRSYVVATPVFESGAAEALLCKLQNARPG